MPKRIKIEEFFLEQSYHQRSLHSVTYCYAFQKSIIILTECLTINYTSQSKKYFYLWKTPWIKNTRILRQAPDPHMGLPVTLLQTSPSTAH